MPIFTLELIQKAFYALIVIVDCIVVFIMIIMLYHDVNNDDVPDGPPLVSCLQCSKNRQIGKLPLADTVRENTAQNNAI